MNIFPLINTTPQDNYNPPHAIGLLTNWMTGQQREIDILIHRRQEDSDPTRFRQATMTLRTTVEETL